ncbi:MAG TPA: phosphodiester glycosidase family protein [Trueperaceae bacterium]
MRRALMGRIFTLVFVVVIFLLGSPASAASQLYRLPEAYVTRTPGAVQIKVGMRSYQYVSGLGWLNAEFNGSPIVEADGVYVTNELLNELGIDLPRLADIRSSHSDVVRIVFELQGVAATDLLASQERNGQIAAGVALELSLPRVLLPQGLPENLYGIGVRVVTDSVRTRAYLQGPPMRYRVFSLQDPPRLVVDATLLSEAAGSLDGAGTPSASHSVEAEAEFDQKGDALLKDRATGRHAQFEQLRPGIVYRQMTVSTAAGKSVVDILEIAPGHGEFRVVGESYAPKPVSELASGAFAGINAGYFDTSSLRAIGLLKIDHTLLSLPRLGRAGIGFGLGRPIVGRVHANLNVRINGRLYYTGGAGDDRLSVYTAAGQMVGGPSQGAIVVQDGRVLANKVAPRQVPQNGFVIVYQADMRELALVEEGDSAAIEADFEPSAFDYVSYAVEAGPLLVEDGRPAYAPSLENFDTVNPLSPVNRRTARAAIGIRPDGTVLFVTATNMTTSELVPLFLSLGAEDALQMDSGGSSTLFAAGQVLNRPASSQRAVATAIVYIPNREAATTP